MSAEKGVEPAHVLVLGGLGLLLVAHGAVITVAAGASCLGGRCTVLSLDQARQVLVALAGGQSTADAWPGGSPPSRPAVVVVSALLLLFAVAAVVAAAWLVSRQHRPAARPGPPSSSFASKRQAHELAVEGPRPGRVVLGTAHGRLVATEPEHSVLVVGATRSGKTTGYAIPALLEWDGPAIVLSAKSDLLHATFDQRRLHGEAQVFDPTGISGFPCDGWSPLTSAKDWRGAVRAANAMSKVSGTTAGLGGAGKHWERVAAQLLGPLLLAASCGGLDMGDVVRWVMTKRLDEAKQLLELLEEDGEVALLSLISYLDLEPRARDSAFSTARTVLDAYEDPDVVDASSRWDIRPSAFLDGGRSTLYLVANSSDQTRLAPVFLALLDELLREAFLRAARRRVASGSSLLKADGSPAPRLLLLLDEAANIAPLPELATLASTAGGEGIQLVTIYQDLSQLRHRYGAEWGSIVSNHVAKVILPGVTDPETLRYFTSAVGDEEVLVTTKSKGSDGRNGTSESLQRRHIVTERDLRELPRGEGLCLYGNRPPLRFELRPPGKSERANGA